jgi:acetyl esterase/lipase
VPSKYAIDEAYLKFPNIRYSRKLWYLRAINLLIKASRWRYQWGSDLVVRQHHCIGVDDNPIKVIEVSPKALGENAPALVYLHGGAFFLSYTGMHLDNTQRYAREAGCRVFIVDYRLSTQALFPAAQEDAQSALEWVHDHAVQLKVDKTRIVIGGDSAGGCLAASCTHMTQDRNKKKKDKIQLLAQFLIYPVTDCETKTDSALNYNDTPLWTHGANKIMWDVYLRDSDYKKHLTGASIPQYASPVHRQDLSGLPPVYIEPAEFDPLRDEAYDYAQALTEAGVRVELVEAKGAVHGYDAINCATTRKYRKIRIEALKALF